MEHYDVNIFEICFRYWNVQGFIHNSCIQFMCFMCRNGLTIENSVSLNILHGVSLVNQLNFLIVFFFSFTIALIAVIKSLCFTINATDVTFMYLFNGYDIAHHLLNKLFSRTITKNLETDFTCHLIVVDQFKSFLPEVFERSISSFK